MDNNVFNNIKNNKSKPLSDNNYVIIIVLCVILVVLFILFFQYTFGKRNSDILKTINYEDHLELKSMPTCGEIIDPLGNYILADYFIASSYNTHLVGNQKYDYSSLDMIRTVLESGARYIELEITKDNIGQNSQPVITSSNSPGNWINGLNVLSLNEAIATIRNNAFTFKKQHINYPLFINLKLNTNDISILDEIYKIIINQLSKKLLEPTKYYKFPISLEKICNLNNKIILFATGEWEHSKLKNIIVPTHQFMQSIHYKDIENFNITPYNKKKYTSTLSNRTEESSLKLFKKKYPTLSSLPNKLNTIKKEIMTEDGFINKLEQYNKIALTLVKPHKPDDIFTLNYDPELAFKYGCTFISMNYQSNDDIMSDYLTIFKESSFVLKQNTLRFHRERQDVQDINTYNVPTLNDTIPIIPDFIKKYKFNIYRLSTLANHELLLTTNNENIGFSKQIKTNKNKNNNQDLLKQCFVFTPSNKYKGAIKIQSAYDNSYLYVYNSEGTELFLKPYENTKDFDSQTTFYPIYPKCQEESYVSFRTLNQKHIKLIGSYNNSHLKLYNDTNNLHLQKITCFYPSIVPTNIYLVIKSVHNGSTLHLIRTQNPDGTYSVGGTLSFSHDINESSKFKIEGEYPDGLFYLRAINNRYVKGFLNKKISAITPYSNISDATLFKLQKEGSMYNIVNDFGEYLAINNDMSVTFKKDKPLIKEAVFNDKNIQLSPNVYGPSLGNKKRFIIKVIYEVK